jgi:methylphosphotriester-DNA--protein-cysteine methyltransferase
VKAAQLAETQNWNDQIHAEFSEVLEKVHVLFRTAKRHDMLGPFTATRRAAAAEALAACEQVFRVLLDKEYAKARRLLEMHSELLGEVDPSSVNSSFLLGQEQEDLQKKEVEGTVEPPL